MMCYNDLIDAIPKVVILFVVFQNNFSGYTTFNTNIC